MKDNFFRNLFAAVLTIFSVFFASQIPLRAQIETNDGEPVNWKPLSRFNLALASAGAVATGSSTYDQTRFPASSAINGDRAGYGWGSGTGGWADATPGSFPDSLEVTFDTVKKISEINVFTVQDNYNNPVEPTLETTFSLYGITSFDVQYWDSGIANWTTISSVSNNNKVWRQFQFPAVTTNAIRIVVNGAVSGSFPTNYSRITEVEAWGGDAYYIMLPEPDQQSVDCGTTNDLDTCEQMRNLLAAMKGGFDNNVELPYGPHRTTLKGQPYANWYSKLNWTYSNWQADGSEATGSLNHPPMAHAISLWRNPAEFNRTRATSIQWWLTFLDCQNGEQCIDPNPGDPASPYKTMLYMKSKELFSFTYDALTVTAIVTVRHWAIRWLEANQGTGNPLEPKVEQLLDKSGTYLKQTFRLYALAAGQTPASSFYHRSNLNDGDSATQGCSTKEPYRGPFVALAGMRSPNTEKCQDTRGVLLARALNISLSGSDWKGKNSLNQIYDYLKANFPANSIRPGENHFALSLSLRNLLKEQMDAPTTTSTQALVDELKKVRTVVKYHFVGLAHSTQYGIKQNRVSLMELNKNRNTAPTYAVKYYFNASRNDYEARILYPWSDKVLTVECGTSPYRPWRKGITTGGFAKFIPHPSAGQPYSRPSSLTAENEPNCFHENRMKIVDTTSMPFGTVKYHIVFSPDKPPQCLTGCTTPVE
ncbi:MAG: discoidin domain-containing protein [Acidobacteriota bacterium]|nr:discoidin domain-containing protein [Acidobacteriota bacterium]